jgi:signal transduction histidine kinase
MSVSSTRTTADKLARLEALLKIAGLMNQSLEPERVLKTLLREVVRITRASSGSIALLDHERGVLDIVSAINIPPRQWRTLKLQLGVGVTGWVAFTGKPLRVADVLRNSHYVQIKPTVRSELAVPLILDGRILGVINVDSTRRAAFSQMDEDLLMAVANHSVRVIEQARLHAAAAAHAQELESLFELGQRLIAPLPLGELIQEVAERGRRLSRANFCLIFLLEGNRGRLAVRGAAGCSSQWPAHIEVDVETSLMGRVVIEKRPLRCANLLDEPLLNYPELARTEGMMSMLAVPIIYRDEVQGVLSTFYDSPRRMEEGEVRLTQLLAGQFAVALENARRYEQLLGMEDSLRRVERFSLLGSLAAEIAHEIRNPVTIIHMLLHSLSETISDETHRRDLAIVMEKLDRINRIVEQTLDMARVREMHLETFSLNDLLVELLFFLRFKLEQTSIRLHQHLDAGLPVVEADRGQLQQVFLNLLVNAIQAMSSGGTLTLRTEQRQDEDLGACAVATVTDTGPGVSEAEQAHLFEPFYTTRAGGTGLGLFISQKLIANHGGRIHLRSARGKGCTFSVWIPYQRSMDE